MRMGDSSAGGPHCGRRTIVAGAVGLVISSSIYPGWAASLPADPDPRWYDAAASMKRLAQSWGDQPYGAVLVLDGILVGEGPSRVVKNQDPNAHAEREAIRDAQVRLGMRDLTGAVLYSTSRPCGLCEAAAAKAGVRRMYFGAALTDAGAPGGAPR
jgi:tRNA(Arg) A34 adenosine deaminase TadA